MTHPLPPKPQRLRRAAKATAKFTAWSGGAFFISLAVVVGVAWILYQNGTLDRWFEGRWKKRFIAEQIARIQPHVPFKIEKVEIDASLKEIQAGRIRDLRVVLSYQEWRGDFHGKLNIDGLSDTTWKNRDLHLDIEYLPTGWLEWKGVRTSEFSIVLKTEIDASLKKGIQPPQRLKAAITSDAFKFSPVLETGAKPSALEIQKLNLNLNLEGDQAQVSLHWNDFTFTHSDLQAHAEAFEIRAESNIVQSLKAKTNAFDFKFSLHPRKSSKPVQSIEALKGDDYFSLPWNPQWKFEASGKISLQGDDPRRIENTPLKELNVQITHGKEIPLSVQIKPDSLRARMKATEIKDLLALLALQPARFFPEVIKEKVKIEKGSIEIEADSLPRTLNQGNVIIHVSDLSARIPAVQFALQGLRVSARAMWNRLATAPVTLHHAEAAISRFGIRNLKGTLAPTSIRLMDQKIEFLPKLGLSFESFPLRIGSTEIRLGKEKGPVLQTQMKLEAVTLDQLNQLFCLGMKRTPPVTLFGDLKKITLDQGTIDPEGTLEAKLFNGWARVENIAVYDPLTAVPEIDFDLHWGGLKLSSIADFLGFGEMNGVIEGHSKDTVFQGPLPTHYDFSVSIKPDRYKDVVFSPEAMKNFVQLFAADALEQVPGIVNWAVWGWPSRVLGGFDVDYAGVSLFSEGGAILLETQDPPKILEKENGKHFFLYGSRFKMPLSGTVYPRVLDAPALAVLTRRIKKQLDTIAENKKNKQDQNQGTEPSKNAYENTNSETTNCQPQL